MLLLLLAGGSGTDPEPQLQEVAARLLSEGLARGQAFALLKELTEAAPSRLAGSPGADAAVAWAESKMTALGLAEVRSAPVTVTRWERGLEEAVVLQAPEAPDLPLAVAALGGSVPTPDQGLEASVVMVESVDEARQLGRLAEGRIVFFNGPMDPAEVDQFTAYGKAAGQRVQGPSAAARVGAVAALVRSLTRNADDHPHTGLLVYDEGVPRIPAAALGLRSADRLAALLASGKDVRVRLRLGCRSLGPATTANVLGQVTGSELPGEVIVLGGHLDAWDLGVGAHDDAAGCVQALEAVRLIHALGLTPRRTIRAVMFMDEEFGGTGGDAYASDPHRDQEKHLAAIESDRGGFLPLGFAADGDAAAVARIAAFLPLLRGAGIQWVQAGGGGTDISPLGEKGTLLIGLVPDSQRYFDAHHSVNDVLDAVHPRELELGAIAMAVLAYALANE